MNSEIRIKITGLVYNQSVVGTYGLVMSEENGKRRFSVMIGEPEAQSIALKLNNKESARPLTHDLIKNLLQLLDTKLEKVVIYDMVNDVFFSELQLKKGGDTIIVDARTSDAVALAVRCECPIYIKSEILDIVGAEIQTDETIEQVQAEKKNELNEKELSMLTTDELEDLLNMAVSEEKYELAVRIRDIIKSKKH